MARRLIGKKIFKFYLGEEKLRWISGDRLERAVMASPYDLSCKLFIKIHRGGRTKVFKFDFPGYPKLEIPPRFTLRYHRMFQLGWKFAPTPMNIWKKAISRWATEHYADVMEHNANWLLKNKRGLEDYPTRAEIGVKRKLLENVLGVIASKTCRNTLNRLIGIGVAIEGVFDKGQFQIQKYRLNDGRVFKAIVGSV